MEMSKTKFHLEKMDSKEQQKPDMVALVCNARTQKAESGELQIQGKPESEPQVPLRKHKQVKGLQVYVFSVFCRVLTSCNNHQTLHKRTFLMRSDSYTSLQLWKYKFRGQFGSTSIQQNNSNSLTPGFCELPDFMFLSSYNTRYEFSAVQWVQILTRKRQVIRIFFQCCTHNHTLP